MFRTNNNRNYYETPITVAYEGVKLVFKERILLRYYDRNQVIN